MRILVDTIPECYTTLGIVHSLWQPIPGEFDDYIANPKGNGYKSLHTVIVGPEDKGVEVQIRTFDMHQFNEFGVAAHWRYKEGGKGDSAYEQKIAWLRQLLDWRENMAESGKEDLAAAFKTELFNDTIYVLTPHGKVLSLPTGATPIDFAYALHSSVGDRCRGAKVEGQIVPLSTPLENGQRVEIITAKEGNPSVNWLYEAGSNPTAPSAKSVPISASKMRIPCAKKAAPSWTNSCQKSSPNPICKHWRKNSASKKPMNSIRPSVRAKFPTAPSTKPAVR